MVWPTFRAVSRVLLLVGPDSQWAGGCPVTARSSDDDCPVAHALH